MVFPSSEVSAPQTLYAARWSTGWQNTFCHFPVLSCMWLAPSSKLKQPRGCLNSLFQTGHYTVIHFRMNFLKHCLSSGTHARFWRSIFIRNEIQCLPSRNSQCSGEEEPGAGTSNAVDIAEPGVLQEHGGGRRSSDCVLPSVAIWTGWQNKYRAHGAFSQRWIHTLFTFLSTSPSCEELYY